MEAAYLEHFKKPMEANECLIFSHLQPFVALLGLEESLTSALPSSCTKPKEQRGGFDDLVLTQLGSPSERKQSLLLSPLSKVLPPSRKLLRQTVMRLPTLNMQPRLSSPKHLRSGRPSSLG